MSALTNFGTTAGSRVRGQSPGVGVGFEDRMELRKDSYAVGGFSSDGAPRRLGSRPMANLKGGVFGV